MRRIGVIVMIAATVMVVLAVATFAGTGTAAAINPPSCPNGTVTKTVTETRNPVKSCTATTTTSVTETTSTSTTTTTPTETTTTTTTTTPTTSTTTTGTTTTGTTTTATTTPPPTHTNTGPPNRPNHPNRPARPLAFTGSPYALPLGIAAIVMFVLGGLMWLRGRDLGHDDA